MWGPGIAAILTTLIVQKKPFRSLNLNRLGPKRYYLWALFLPFVLTLVGGLFTLLFGIAKLDTSLRGLPVMFLQPGFNMSLGGTLATAPAWLAMMLFIGWLILSKRLPVKVTEEVQEGEQIIAR